MRKAQKRLILHTSQCLILQPALAKHFGKSGAFFLQQLHYWLNCEKPIGKEIDGKRWIYNSMKAWASQLCLSERQISRIINQLKGVGVLLVNQLSKQKSDRTNWYRINYHTLESLFPNVPGQPEQSTGDFFHLTDKTSESSSHKDHVYNKETKITSKINPFLTKNAEEIKNSLINHFKEDSTLRGIDSGNQNTLAKDLLEIWNQTVGQEQGERFAQLTKKRTQYLVAAFKYCFESNLTKWKQFCKHLTSSDFLMGKVKSTFKASLDWVLRFDVIQRILEGDFGVKALSFSEEETPSFDIKTLHNHIESHNHDSQSVKHFRKTILKIFGDKTYHAWFSKLAITQTGGEGDITLQANSSFVKDYIQIHYLRTLEGLTGKVVNVFS